MRVNSKGAHHYPIRIDRGPGRTGHAWWRRLGARRGGSQGTICLIGGPAKALRHLTGLAVPRSPVTCARRPLARAACTGWHSPRSQSHEL